MASPTDPPPFGPSTGVPTTMPSSPSGGTTGPIFDAAGNPIRRPTLLGPGGPVRTFLRRWGFPLFALVVVVLGRRVLLPFIFAALIAYILAPVIRWMTERKDGTRRMP